MKRTDAIIRLEEERFRGYLRKNRLRFTPGRRIVFEAVLRAHGHFTAEDLVKTFRRSSRPGVSRASIYRYLRELLEAGIVRETAYGVKHQHYEHLYDEEPHHHARCLKCMAVFEFPCQCLDTAYRFPLEREGFVILGHEMHLYGVCARCRGTRGRRTVRRREGGRVVR